MQPMPPTNFRRMIIGHRSELASLYAEYGRTGVPIPLTQEGITKAARKLQGLIDEHSSHMRTSIMKTALAEHRERVRKILEAYENPPRTGR